MSLERKVTIIPPVPKFIHRVAIYCRVSTRSQEQLDSLANQISYLTRLVTAKIDWHLVDIYIDIKPGSNTSARNEFERMINDCQNGKIDIIVTKSVSRFGRNTAATLNALNTIRSCRVDVYFENEEIHTSSGQNTFVISLLEGIAQEESTSRSKNISWGILRKIESGDAALLRRKCYGFYQDNAGDLQIQQEEANIVKLIFDMYLNGASVIKIVQELESRALTSPSGKAKWCKRTIDSILSNEKYTGNVIACKTYNKGFPETKRYTNRGEKDKYIAFGCNPAIISDEEFKMVQEEKNRRSNVIKSEDGIKRKTTHYSSKHKEG